MASKAIKGITIKLDGETGELTKTITDADKSLRSLENQLKAVNKALELDPTNMELLAQKQDLLSKEIETTKQKLEAEKLAAEQAAQALQEGTITQTEYDALQTEIQNTTNDLKELENKAKESGSTMGASMKAVGDKLQEVGGKVTEFGTKWSQNVTAPIVATGAAAIAAFADVQGGLDNIAKLTGATGDNLEEMEGIAKNIATTIPTEFDVAAKAVGGVNTKFGATGDELEKLSKKFVEFADLNNTDVTNSINSTQQALAAYGLGADEASAYLDFLNATAQKSGASVIELNNLVANNAATFDSMGFSISDAVAFLGDLELSGADSTAVLGGLRKALAAATDQGTPLSEALAQLQTDMQNAEGDTEVMQRAIDLFGTKSGPVIANLAKNGKLNFADLGTSLDQYNGNIDTTYKNTVHGTDEMKVSYNKVKAAGAEFGDSISGALVPILDSLAEAIEDLSEWWNTLDEDTQTQIINAALLIAAIGPVITVIGSLITNVGVIISTFGTLATFVTGTLIPAIVSLASTITASVMPVIVAFAPVILAVVAAVAAVVAVVEAVKSVIENADAWIWGFQQLWEGLKDTFQSVWDKIVEVKDGIVDTVEKLVNKVTGFFTGLVDSALTWGKDMIQSFIDGMLELWDKFSGTVEKYAGKVADFLGFSEPDQGPLSRFHTFAPDMVDLWNKTLLDHMDEVEASANIMAETTAAPLENVDYTGALSNISGQLAGIGTGATIPPINLTTYIGGRRFEREVVAANAENNFIAGG